MKIGPLVFCTEPWPFGPLNWTLGHGNESHRIPSSARMSKLPPQKIFIISKNFIISIKSNPQLKSAPHSSKKLSKTAFPLLVSIPIFASKPRNSEHARSPSGSEVINQSERSLHCRGVMADWCFQFSMEDRTSRKQRFLCSSNSNSNKIT